MKKTKWNYKSSFLICLGWGNMKNAFPFSYGFLLDEKEKSNLHCITAIYLSIQKHFQSSAKYCIRKGEITRKGNPCESSAKLENHFCDVLIECENDFSAFLFPKQEWNTKFIDLRGSSSFARSWAGYSWLSEHKFEGTNIRRDVLDFEGRIDTVLTEELNVLEVWRRSFDKWNFF